jgi:hypothetical protein
VRADDGMSIGPASLVAAWLAVTIGVVTAACMITVTVGGIRNRLRPIELFAWLLAVSIAVPPALRRHGTPLVGDQRQNLTGRRPVSLWSGSHDGCGTS